MCVMPCVQSQVTMCSSSQAISDERNQMWRSSDSVTNMLVSFSHVTYGWLSCSSPAQSSSEKPIMGRYCQILNRNVRSGWSGLTWVIEAYREQGSVLGCALRHHNHRLVAVSVPGWHCFCFVFFVLMLNIYNPFCVWEDAGWVQAGILCICVCWRTVPGPGTFCGGKESVVTSLCGPLPSPPLNSLAFIGVYPSQYFSYFFFFDCMSPIALLQIKLGRAQTSGVSHSATFNLWEM